MTAAVLERPTLARNPVTRAYGALDSGWKHLLDTGPKWFREHVWRDCLFYVRRSNAWCGRGGRYRDEFDPEAR